MPRKAPGAVIRALALFHRYVGIVLGLMMLVWCLSGVVMIYVSYPALSETARVGALAPIDWHQCCAVDRFADGDSVYAFQVEMLGAHPVVRMRTADGGERLINLSDGSIVSQITEAQARSVAQRYAGANPVELDGLIDHDQWTVAGDFELERPLYRYAVQDSAGTQVYVSGHSGSAVQLTTRHERFWNWLGPIPHWLYFAGLRQHFEAWSNVLVYVAVAGALLVLAGLSVGISEFFRRPRGRWSKLHGALYGHHVVGLIFGLLLLSWVTSGLVSMNPWGFLAGSGARAEYLAISGGPVFGAQVKSALRAMATAGAADSWVSVASAPLLGRLYLIATREGGERIRLDELGAPAPLTSADARQIAQTLGGPTAFSGPELLAAGDAYYFTHHSDHVRLPIYRVVLQNGVRYYVDPFSGALSAKLDTDERGYRWLHEAVHRLDFSASLRARPLWDLVMLVLLAGVTTVSGLGVYLGLRRVLLRPATPKPSGTDQARRSD